MAAVSDFYNIIVHQFILSHNFFKYLIKEGEETEFFNSDQKKEFNYCNYETRDRLCNNNWSYTVWVGITFVCSFIADEELGGHEGMELYVVSKEFKDLNIGLALDEGLASEDNTLPLFYGERCSFWVQFKCNGISIN